MIEASLAKRIAEISKHEDKQVFLAFRQIEDNIIWEAKGGHYHIRVCKESYPHDYDKILDKLSEKGYIVEKYSTFAVVRWKNS